jgi:branched-chain amino acid transport system permease protein
MHLGISRSQMLAAALMVACIALLPFVLYPVFLMKVMCYALFACAFNLVLGYAGLLPFGHAAFFGTGAYIGAWTAKALMLTPELAILCGGTAGGMLGIAFGFLAIRRQGLDFAMITLALAQMTYFFYLQAPFTNGEDGIQKVPRGDALGVLSLEPDMTMYWFVSAIFLGGFALIYRVVHSPFGNVLKGIRENEARASSLGYRANSYKLIAFGLSAFLAAIAGATKTHVFGIATLSDASLETSSLVLLMALLGGKGTIFGPVVGAVLVVSMESKLATIGSWVMIAQGIVFIACVLLFRRGIVGEINRGLRTSL